MGSATEVRVARESSTRMLARFLAMVLLAETCYLVRAFSVISTKSVRGESGHSANCLARSSPWVRPRLSLHDSLIDRAHGSRVTIGISGDGWQGESDDPWEDALDALEAQRRDAREAAERGNAKDSVALGWESTDSMVLLDSEREREDESADWCFYDGSRLVFHADTDALNRLTAIYRELLPAG